MSAHQSTQWFWSDWSGDLDVRRLTPAERGLWIDLLALAAVGKPTGYVCDQRGNPISYEEIARFANCTPTEAESLIAGILDKGVGSRDRTGRLFNRRMTRQAERSAKKKRAGKLGAEQTKKVWSELKLSAAARASPEHLPGHVPRHHEPALTIPNKITSTFVGVARATAETVPEQKGLGNEGSKPISQLTRAELEASFAARKISA